MNVITITAQTPDSSGVKRQFHFNSSYKADRFIQTIRSHRIDMEFIETPDEIKPTKELLMEIDKDPIKYAVESVAWAKEVTREESLSHLTDAEMQYIRQMAY